MRLAGRPLALAAALVAASAVVRAALVAAPPVSDEAAHLLGSATLLDGGQLYLDFVDNKPPLLYAFFAAAQAVLGRGIAAVRLVAVLLVVPLTGLAAAAFYRYDRRGVVAGMLYVLLSGCLLPEDALPVHAELLMLLPAGWAVVLLCGATPSGSALGAQARSGAEAAVWVQAAAGGLLGLAALVKPTAGLWLLAAPLALLLRDPGRAGFRAAARAGIACSAGFLLPLASTAAVFARSGTLGELADRCLLANARYVAAPLPWQEALARAARGALPWLATTGAAWWAYLRSRRDPDRSRSLLVDALLLCSLPAVAVGFRFYGHYFLQLLFPLCLGAAPRLARFDRPARAALALLVATAVAFTGVNAWLVLARDDVVEDTFPLHRDVAAFLRQDACHPGATVFVWGLAPRLYLELGLRPASRFVLPQETISGYQPGRREPASAVDPGDRQRLLEDLERSRATYVLDLAPSGFHRWDRFPLATFPALLELVRRDYEVAGTVDGVVIHRRRGCAAESHGTRGSESDGRRGQP